MRLLLFLLNVACLTVVHARAGSPTKHPNVIVLLIDDMGFADPSCFGNPLVKTPHIDTLARGGLKVTNFYVNSPICSASRTALATGQYQQRWKIHSFLADRDAQKKRRMANWLDPKSLHTAQVFKDAGYATAHFGKWHLSNNMIPDSPAPSEYGYDTYGAFNCSGEQMPVHEDAQNAIKFMEKSQSEGKPFFINLWVHEPHTPFHVVPKYQQRFPELDEEDNIYASVLSHADDRIGEVLDALDRLKLTENTLVVFSSDNGPARAKGDAKLDMSYDSATGVGYGIAASKGITGGRKGYKASIFEGGIGVPFIARWPGKIAADKEDAVSLISAVDLLPTFCEVAGAKLPDDYIPDGVSQVATLMGTPYPKREKPLFWLTGASSTPKNSDSYHWVTYAIVDQHWKLLSNRDSSHMELYDLESDPFEKNNLAEEKAEVLASLKEKLEAWKATLPEKADPNCFSNERK